MDWEGFTDSDLNRFKSCDNESKKSLPGPKIVKPITRGKAATARTNKPYNGSQKESIINKKTKTVQSVTANLTPADACLAKPGQANNSPNSSDHNRREPDADHNLNKQESVGIAVNQQNNDGVQALVTVSSDVCEATVLTDNDVIQQKEQVKLEDVHRRQKIMEERNKRRKAMLSKEIAQRRKKTQEESSKLADIQIELGKLDQLLNYDVSIVRDKIEEACHDYSSATKRFEKAEAEYVAAKINLHKKTILKEDLTAHLYHLIQANEERKASKLDALMKKLDVEEVQELVLIDSTEQSRSDDHKLHHGDSVQNALSDEKNNSATADNLHGANADSAKPKEASA